MSAIEDLAKALVGIIGENSGSAEVTDFIDTGFPPLNKIISGSYDNGIPQGRLIEMYGPSSAGKTAIATHLMVQAQKMGGVAGFMDHEKSFDVGMASSMGLRTDFPFWIYKRPTTWEESNTMMAKAAQAIRQSKAIPDTAPVFFVFDSIASAMPKSQVEKEMTELNMNDTTALARVTSTTLKSMASFAADYNFTVLYLNQIRLKPGVSYGDPTTTPGGKAMEFFATTRIELSRRKIMQDTKGGKEFVGQEITMKTVKNKLTRPFQQITWNMMFNEDGSGFFDVVGAMVDHACDTGKLTKAGAYIQWLDGKKYHRKALVALITEQSLQGELRALIMTA